MAKITEDMTIYEVLQIAPDIAPVFFEFGMRAAKRLRKRLPPTAWTLR